MAIFWLWILPALLGIWLVSVMTFKTYEDKEHKQKTKLPVIVYLFGYIVTLIPLFNAILFIAGLILYSKSLMEEDIYTSSWLFQVK